MLALDLPPIALAFLASKNANRDGPRADAAATTALLTGRGYPAHAALLAFEAAYGGLQMFDADPSAPSLVVGPFACFSATPHYTGQEGDRVPVIFAWDDMIHSLDASGRGFTCASMVEGVSRPCARDGRQLLTQAILWRALLTHASVKMQALEMREGRHGGALAKDRDVPPIADATSATDRWWGDGERFVVEIERGNGYEHPMTYATA